MAEKARKEYVYEDEPFCMGAGVIIMASQVAHPLDRPNATVANEKENSAS